jgi:hypothetical protein
MASVSATATQRSHDEGQRRNATGKLYPAFLFARDRDRGFDGKAEITDRSRAFTSFEDRNTDATSGSSMTAIEPSLTRPANRFDRDLRGEKRGQSLLMGLLALREAYLVDLGGLKFSPHPGPLPGGEGKTAQLARRRGLGRLGT